MFGRIDAFNFSMIDKSYPVALPGLVHNGSRHDDGNARFTEIMKRLPKLFARYRIDSRSRFIQKDRKSTRLNSSHANISYAVFCLKKKKKYGTDYMTLSI